VRETLFHTKALTRRLLFYNRQSVPGKKGIAFLFRPRSVGNEEIFRTERETEIVCSGFLLTKNPLTRKDDFQRACLSDYLTPRKLMHTHITSKLRTELIAEVINFRIQSTPQMKARSKSPWSERRTDGMIETTFPRLSWHSKMMAVARIRITAPILQSFPTLAGCYSQ
jgi:hypothetical protein